MAIIMAKYDDFCRKCYAKISKGEKVFWEKDAGIMHYKCGFKK